ncbi:MAG: hypothetical protein WC728_10135 [Elusimicrobiota bacterium]
MALLSRGWAKTAGLLFAGFVVLGLWRDIRGRERTVAFLIDHREVRALCSVERIPESEFLERARRMGVGAVLLRPQDLDRFFRSGDLLRASGPLKGHAFWARDPGVLERLRVAARYHDFELQEEEFGGLRSVALPEGVEPQSLSIGYDPQDAARISARELIPAYYVETGPDLLLAQERGLPAMFVIAPGYRHPRQGGLPLLRDALQKGGAWAVFANAAGLEPDGVPAMDSIGNAEREERSSFLDGMGSLARVLTAGELPADSSLAAGLGQAQGRGNGVLLLHLVRGRSVEENLSSLRRLIRQMRGAGVSSGIPAGPREARSLSAVEWWARFLLAGIVTVGGPLLAMRQGIRVVRGMHRAGRLPIASPLLEVLSGTWAAVGVSLLSGLAAYALLSAGAWRLGASLFGWGLWAPGVTLLFTLAGLYVPDAEELAALRRARSGSSAPQDGGVLLSLRRRIASGPKGQSVRLACLLLFTALVFFAPHWLERFGPRAWAAWGAAREPAWWWAVDRWREWAVGTPCLFVGLWIFVERLKKSPADLGRQDPRPWLLLGMFSPIGLADALARAQTPFEDVVLQTLSGLVVGTLIGLALLASRKWVARGTVQVVQ